MTPGVVRLPWTSRELLSHLALAGLAAIVDRHTGPVRTGWDTHGPWIAGDQVDDATLGAAVQQHASAAHAPGSWISADHDGRPTFGLRPGNRDAAQRAAQRAARERVLDGLTDSAAWDDLRMITALGDPTQWPDVVERLATGPRTRPPRTPAFVRRVTTPLDMQPANGGGELVRSRLRPLAAALAQRHPRQVAAGLTGRAVVDDLIPGSGSFSYTATGFRRAGPPVDSAVAWCALWGIGEAPPPCPRADATIAAADGDVPVDGPTGGLHIGPADTGWFYVPLHQDAGPTTVRRLWLDRRVLTVARWRLPGWSAPDAESLAAHAWCHGQPLLLGVLRFPVELEILGRARYRWAHDGSPVTSSSTSPRTN